MKYRGKSIFAAAASLAVPTAFSPPATANEKDWLDRLEAFLAKHNPPDAPPG